MSDLITCSYNVRGFNSPMKRAQILTGLHKQRVMIVFLQETHFKTGHRPQFKNRYYKNWYFSDNPDSKSKGVAIAIHKQLNYSLLNTVIDPNGRYIFMKLNISGHILTLVNCYAPNQNQHKFLEMVVTRLESFQEGVTIFGGDFNVSLDPTLDTSSGKSNLSYNKLKHIKTQFHSNQLMDSWRTFHPGEKDYSYFSPVHQTYSRIDYLFLSHAALEWVTETKIGIQLLSDHAPIYLKLSLPISERRAWTWRLNESLLRDKDCISDLKSELKFFKEVHAPDTTHPVIKWEALKAVLRGVLIKHGSRHKRAQSQLITDLTQKISKLEQLHKNSLTENTLTELTTTRELLKAELNKKSTYALQKCKSLYYENSNKPGKLLARAVKQKIGMSYIPAIKTQNDKIVYKTTEIASTMHKYYSDLYNIKKPTDIAEGAFLQKIKAYINKTALPCLKQEERDL
uniref:exodeoxyribonuclease III n=1 Tax=Xenopus tropicalis TaxID=8364 RepID=A0A803JIX0_XENTR